MEAIYAYTSLGLAPHDDNDDDDDDEMTQAGADIPSPQKNIEDITNKCLDVVAVTYHFSYTPRSQR